MRILWINPVGTDQFDIEMGRFLVGIAASETRVDVVSLPDNRPKHLEYHSYEALVTPDILSITHHLSKDYDAIVIACYYDVALQEAREVSGAAFVVAPCQASLTIASHLGNRFSILVGREKWIPKMEDKVHHYGYGHSLASFRSLGLGVYDFESNPEHTLVLMEKAGRKAIEEDGAEVLILGCTVEFGFQQALMDRLEIPVVDAVAAPFQVAEMLGRASKSLSLSPSRKGGSEPPPDIEIGEWNLFGSQPPIGNFIHHSTLIKTDDSVSN